MEIGYVKLEQRDDIDFLVNCLTNSSSDRFVLRFVKHLSGYHCYFCPENGRESQMVIRNVDGDSYAGMSNAAVVEPWITELIPRWWLIDSIKKTGSPVLFSVGSDGDHLANLAIHSVPVNSPDDALDIAMHTAMNLVIARASPAYRKRHCLTRDEVDEAKDAVYADGMCVEWAY